MNSRISKPILALALAALVLGCASDKEGKRAGKGAKWGLLAGAALGILSGGGVSVVKTSCASTAKTKYSVA